MKPRAFGARSLRSGLGELPLASLAALALLVLILATTLEPLWTVLVATGLTTGLVILAMPRKQEVLWTLFLLTLPLAAGNWIGDKTKVFYVFGENPPALLVFLSDVPLAALLALWFLERCVGKGRPVARSPLLHAFLAMAIWRLITAFVSERPTWVLWNALYFWKYLLAFLWASSHLGDRRWLRLTVAALIAGLLVQIGINVASYVLRAHVTLFGLLEYDAQRIAGRDIFRATGSVGPHNAQTHFYELFVPLAAVCAITCRGAPARLVSLIALVGGLLATLVTFSRGGWVGVTLASATLAWLLLEKRLVSRPLLAVALLAAVTFVAVALFGPDDRVRLRLFQSPRQATSARIHTLQAGLRIIGRHPVLGVGTNQHPQVLDRYFPRGVPPDCWWLERVGGPSAEIVKYRRVVIPIHNKYVAVAAEQGLVGLALYLWFLTAFVRAGLAAYRSDDPWLASLGAWIVASNAGVLVHQLLDTFNNMTVLHLYLLVAGIAAALADQARGEAPAPSPRARRTRVLFRTEPV